MDKQGRGRGSRGRSRQTDQPQQQQQPGASQPQSAARPVGAWGAGNPMRAAPPQPQQSFPPQPKSSWGPPAQQQQPQTAQAPRQTAPVGGRAQLREPEPVGRAETKTGTVVGPAGDAGLHAGRGAFRGRRAIPENIITRLPSIGKQGTSGQKVSLQTNYFRLEKRTDWCIFQYRVDFAPDIDVTQTKKKLFYAATQSLQLKGIFDGTVLYTSFRINPDPKELVVDSLTGEDKVRLVIRLVGVVDKSSFAYLTIYNLIVRKCMSHLKLQLVGRDFYDPNNKITISKLNMELWPGILSSIRQHESDVLMCAEIKHKVMKNETALNLLNEASNDRRGAGDWKAKFTERILNSIVITEYNNKTYRIDDIDFDSSPCSTFELKDGSKISFLQYYKDHYGITITNMKQPLLVSQAKARDIRAGGAEIIKLIPELCRITGLTEQERANRSMMAEIADYMRPTPDRRIENLRRFNRRLQGTQECVNELKQWDLTLSKDIISVCGRQLETETLNCQGGSYSATPDADWTKNMRSKPLFRNGDLSCWAIVYPPREKTEVQAFYNHMVKATQGMHWKIEKPIIKEMGGYDSKSYMKALEEVCASQPNIKLFFVVTGRSGDMYNLIKKKLTVERGVPSQVVTSKTLNHKSAFSIATKVVIQMNCKVGGAPWSIRIPSSSWMICGFDVCHDPKNRSQSFGAFVASYDRDATCYYSTVAHHKDGEELSNFIGNAICKAINHYAKANAGRIPDKIIFYRDGVGDGQLNYVYEHELRLIRQNLEESYRAHNKPVMFRLIIVNKRINTRFFHNGKNPGPGTVVDDVVTQPDRSDFYLIPQCTRQGTVSPTYYNILGPDNFGLDSDKTQIISYRLCHQYYNWSGTVRVPAPCQYAHKLAFLAAQTLQRPPKENLNHLLHFL